MNIIAEISITPLGIGVSLSKYIAECQRIFNKRKLTIQLHSEGTNIEGEFDVVMDAIKECIETVHKLGAPRIVTHVRISSRTDKTEHMQEKIDSVNEKAY